MSGSRIPTRSWALNYRPRNLARFCKVAMVYERDDPSLGYDVFVCKKCGTKFLVHHPTPESEDED